MRRSDGAGPAAERLSAGSHAVAWILEDGLLGAVPPGVTRYGFKDGPGGIHDSRTIMLAELTHLLAACPRSVTLADYRMSVVEDNTLLKDSLTAREGAFRRLRELYACDPAVLLFRVLRDLWDAEPAAQPLLAALCAVARDPVFRGTAPLIAATPPGELVTSQILAEAAGQAVPGRYNPAILAKIGRNIASSWTQSGHLQGRSHKVRVAVTPHPTSVAYALLLGHRCGERGEALFETLWARLLDAPVYRLREGAIAASQMGWLEYRSAGSVTEITFNYLLRDI